MKLEHINWFIKEIIFYFFMQNFIKYIVKKKRQKVIYKRNKCLCVYIKKGLDVCM